MCVVLPVICFVGKIILLKLHTMSNFVHTLWFYTQCGLYTFGLQCLVKYDFLLYGVTYTARKSLLLLEFSDCACVKRMANISYGSTCLEFNILYFKSPTAQNSVTMNIFVMLFFLPNPQLSITFQNIRKWWWRLTSNLRIILFLSFREFSKDISFL